MSEEDKPYETPTPKSDKYGVRHKPEKTEREIMMQTHPRHLERVMEERKKDEPFKKAWDDLIKFGDCPVCHGDPMRCPESDKPASACSRRRNAIKHSQGKSAIRQMRNMSSQR